jgi:hypothetical protein
MEEKADFTRFFWAPEHIDFQDPRQHTFFTSLEQGEYGMDRTEFVRGSLEELKRLTLRRLQEAPEGLASSETPAKSEASVRMIYLICDPKDQETIEPIEDHLFDLGYEVKVSSHDGDAKLRTEIHRQMLTVCDGVLIYFGHGSHQWVEMTLMDILKAPAYGRKQALEAQAVLVAPPFNRRKERFRTRSALVTRCDEATFCPQNLSLFLEKLGPPTFVNGHG